MTEHSVLLKMNVPTFQKKLFELKPLRCPWEKLAWNKLQKKMASNTV